jgi:GMP synthase-like glutamine amidotransferase
VNVLFLKNITTEGPGTIEDHLRSRKIRFSIVDLSKGEPLPSVDSFSHLVVLGGPMAVYEMDRYPYLSAEARLIDEAITKNKRVLGVCLGAQMLAHVLGERVYAGQQKEIGWHEVALTQEGMQDPAMSALAVDGRPAAEVFQWHGDTFDLPDKAVRLASSDVYPNQAFRFSGGVYALQFHIEVTPRIVLGWLKDEKGVPLKSITADSERIYSPYRKRAEAFYSEFFKTA